MYNLYFIEIDKISISINIILNCRLNRSFCFGSCSWLQFWFWMWLRNNNVKNLFHLPLLIVVCSLCKTNKYTNPRVSIWLQYFSTPESQSLRCDLIRFIVGVIHPTNEVLCSDIIPRWAVIGWLLTTCTSSTAAANAKCALFYDWFFFDAVKDNIMNIGECCTSERKYFIINNRDASFKGDRIYE